MNSSTNFEQTLLSGWEDVYKKSQLTLWILVALKDAPKHMAEIKQFIMTISGDAMAADDQSMYRALRRFRKAQMVDFTMRAGRKGPDLKQYYLTGTGRNVLAKFLDRNITPVFYNKQVQQLLQGEQ